MIDRKKLIWLMLLAFTQASFAQATKKFLLEFQPVFGKLGFNLNDSFYKLNNSDSIQFETVRFYISEIKFGPTSTSRNWQRCRPTGPGWGTP